jgi:hypothetical protein
MNTLNKEIIKPNMCNVNHPWKPRWKNINDKSSTFSRQYKFYKNFENLARLKAENTILYFIYILFTILDINTLLIHI